MAEQRPAKYGTLWTRDELIVAFELYCRIPFQKTKASNPEVQRIASLIQRSPASVARKLGNFGALDPRLQALEISGLAHTGRLDRETWDEFHQDWSGLVVESAKIREDLTQAASPATPSPPSGPSETLAQTKRRLHQSFFRDAVLAAYDGTCCVTGLPVTECIVAAHIIPWSKDEGRRADPTNGLCLSATFEKLFDRGLIAVREDLTIEVHRDLLSSSHPVIQERIAARRGKRIVEPARFGPDPVCLAWHFRNVFLAA